MSMACSSIVRPGLLAGRTAADESVQRQLESSKPWATFYSMEDKLPMEDIDVHE